MNILKKGLALVLVIGGVSSAYADAGVIQGYFRVQNEGNQKYVEVTGPFTAKPNVVDPQQSAGTIMYLEAQQNGNSYEITSLRCQGIDVVGTDIDPEDYQTVMSDALSRGSSAIYGLMQEGLLHGYTSVARAAVGTVFWFVASYLDGYAGDLKKPDGTTYTQQDFLDITTNFNKNVTANLDLGIRLAPVANKNNTLQMYFDVPSLDIVSNWYTNKDNYDTFTAAMMAMRAYLAKYDIDLEAFTADDVALFQSWNYNITEATGVSKETADGSPYEYTTNFTEIFSDPILLFNWLKWVGYMVLNPKEDVSKQHNLSEMLTNLGIGDISGSLNNHYLTNMLINYLPRLHYNTRAYLINGKVVNGAWQSKDDQLDFANETELTYAAKENGNWILVPVDNKSENGKFIVPLTQQWTDPTSKETKNYAAVYYDFEVTAADETTALNTLSAQQSSMGYEYVTLVQEDEEIPAQTAMVISSESSEVQLNVGDGTYTITALDPSLFDNDESDSTPEGALQVTDEMENTNKQHIRRKINTDNSNFKGVLLATESFRINDYWDINPSQTPVYGLFTTADVLSSTHLVFENNGGDLNANQAIYVYPNNNTYYEDYVLINAPKIEVSVGETNTGEEEEGDDQTAIKIAQGFVGDGANIFEGLISMPADLTYEEDFTIQISALSAEGWATPENSSDLSQSYLDAFLQIQPAPSDAGSDYIPGLYTQYTSLYVGHDNVTVDGFYNSELTATASAGEADGSGKYSYNLTFNAPCSGIYEMTITGIGDYEGMTSGPHKIKIYPNLYAIFGADRGFNINGYSFTTVEEAKGSTLPNGSYVIYFPKDYSDKLNDVIGYIPGTYFNSSLSSNAPNAVNKENMRRQANSYTSAYFTKMDVSGFVNQNEPLEVTVEKNGVSATYQFYLATTDNADNVSTGIESIENESDAPVEYYNLQGIRVINPERGIYIVKKGNEVKKVFKN